MCRFGVFPRFCPRPMSLVSNIREAAILFAVCHALVFYSHVIHWWKKGMQCTPLLPSFFYCLCVWKIATADTGIARYYCSPLQLHSNHDIEMRPYQVWSQFIDDFTSYIPFPVFQQIQVTQKLTLLNAKKHYYKFYLLISSTFAAISISMSFHNQISDYLPSILTWSDWLLTLRNVFRTWNWM